MAAALVLALGTLVPTPALSGKGKAKAKKKAPVAAEAGPTRPAPEKLGNIGVLILLEEGADEFTADYIAELLLAGAGGSSPFQPLYPEVMRTALAAMKSDSASCARKDACLQELASRIALHHVIVVTMKNTSEATGMRLEIATPLATGVLRESIAVAAVGEEPLIMAAPGLGESIAERAPVATVRLEGPDDLGMTIDGKKVASPAGGRLHLAAGSHEVALHHAGHASWSTKVELEAGKRYLLRARFEK